MRHTTPRPDQRPALRALALSALFLVLPMTAFAHPGHADGAPFVAGLGHPLGGLDHALAMIGVGLFAATSGGRALWAMPLCFLAAMLAGGVAGLAGLALPGVEPVILASSVVLGLAAALALRLRQDLVLAGIAVLGFAHGQAHGAEGLATPAYVAGFLLATAALHGAGLLAGRSLIRAKLPRVLQSLGAVTALAGLSLAMG